jgi:hypothetical protein
VMPGGQCTASAVCIGNAANKSECIKDDTGQACHDVCTANSQCKSKCCATSTEGNHYCAAAEYCPTGCKSAEVACTTRSECCGGSDGTAVCVTQDGLGTICQPYCTTNSQCPSGCCASLAQNAGYVCAPVVYCQ